MAEPLTESDKLPDFPNWEIPPKSDQEIDPVKAYEDWLADWRARIKSGQLTLEDLRRHQPVDAPFEI